MKISTWTASITLSKSNPFYNTIQNDMATAMTQMSELLFDQEKDELNFVIAYNREEKEDGKFVLTTMLEYHYKPSRAITKLAELKVNYQEKKFLTRITNFLIKCTLLLTHTREEVDQIYDIVYKKQLKVAEDYLNKIRFSQISKKITELEPLLKIGYPLQK